MLQLLPARLSKLVQPVFGAKPIPLSFSERKFCERQSYSVLAWDLLDPHESHKLKCHSDRFGAFFPLDFVLLLLAALTGGSELSWEKVAMILLQFSWICLYTK